MIVDSPAPGRVAFAAPGDPALVTVSATPPPPRLMKATADGRMVLLPVPAPPDARVVAVVADESGVDGRTVGSVLLIVGLAGLVPATLFLLWLGPGRGRAAARTTTTV